MSKYDDLQKHMMKVATGIVPVLQEQLRDHRLPNPNRGFEQHYPSYGAHCNNEVFRYQSSLTELYVQWQAATHRWREAAERVKKERRPFGGI